MMIKQSTPPPRMTPRRKTWSRPKRGTHAWPLLAVLIAAACGCGSNDQPQAARDSSAAANTQQGTPNANSQFSKQPAGAANKSTNSRSGNGQHATNDTANDVAQSTNEQLPANDQATGGNPLENQDAGASQNSLRSSREPRFWNDAATFDAQASQGGFFPRPTFDDEQLAAAGIHHISGPRLDLYTDVTPTAAIEDLPRVFELAHAKWHEFFEMDAERDSAWRMNGFLMADRQKFIEAGLLPTDLEFENGYTRDFEFWMDEQPTDYYRRHLMLHEGTHGFMLTHISGNYPEWFFEGMAELLATHKLDDAGLDDAGLDDAGLAMPYYPRDENEVPSLGRIRYVRESYQDGNTFPLQTIMTHGIHMDVLTETYSWCWAWCAMMDGTEQYHARFRKLFQWRRRPDFVSAIENQFSRDEWVQINDNWQVFVQEIEHDYDFERNAIAFAPGTDVPPEGAEIRVAADRGWQSSGVRLVAGQTYEITARGRYVIRHDKTTQPPTVWESEPQGIAVQYHSGLPLGTLEAAIVPDERDPGAASPFTNSAVVSTGGTETAQSTGTLYLRINDFPNARADNQGAAQVRVRKK